MQSLMGNSVTVWCFTFHQIARPRKRVLMRDKKLCRNNMMISSQTMYVNKICRPVANTRIKRSYNKNNAIKMLAQLHFMNIHPQNITHLGKYHYTPNASTKSIYYCKIMLALIIYYIPIFIKNPLLNLCWEWEISLCNHMLLN